MTNIPSQFELSAQIELLQQQVTELQQRLDRWAQNGLDILDTSTLFIGTNGTSKHPARNDHT